MQDAFLIKNIITELWPDNIPLKILLILIVYNSNFNFDHRLIANKYIKTAAYGYHHAHEYSN